MSPRVREMAHREQRREREREWKGASQDSLSSTPPEGDGGVEGQDPLTQSPGGRGECPGLHLVEEALGQRVSHIQLTSVLTYTNTHIHRPTSGKTV